MNLPGTFSGRWDELYLFAECVNLARRGQPQVILIEGETGIGKTALLRAFEAANQQRDERAARVFTVAAPEESRYDPVLQAVLAVTAKRIYDRVGGKREAKDLFFEWIGAIPGVGDLAAAIGATADAVHRRRRKANAAGVPLDEDVEALMLAARRPLTLLLDDLHLAEPPAIARLEALIRASVGGTRLLLVGTYRPAGPMAAEPSIRKLIDVLPAGSVRHRKLRALTVKEMTLWVDKQFPRAAKKEAFLDWLSASTGGHPATVERTLAHLLDQSLIRFVNGHWEIHPDPDWLEVQQASDSTVDLSGIKPEIAEVVRTASVLGEEFDGSSLAALLEQDELYVEDQLALGVHHGLVGIIGEVTLPDGEISTLYRFATPYLRSSLYRSLVPERRAELERRQREAIAVFDIFPR
ncbi:MAG: AAA family ATPase [Chloroflexota bacterium]|nr:AAA family ATPase [Chloroflexota bacterium]